MSLLLWSLLSSTYYVNCWNLPHRYARADCVVSKFDELERYNFTLYRHDVEIPYKKLSEIK